MKIKINSILFFALLLIINSLSGQELLTLDEAIAIALENNQWIQVSKNNAEISKNNAHIGNAGLLPKLDINSGVNYNDNQLKTDLGEMNESETRTNAGIQVSYTLFNGLNNIYSYKKLKSSAQIGELSARNSIESELLFVINGYYAVARAAENLNSARESVTISKERYERAKKRSSYGQANKIDVLNAEVDLNADSVVYCNAALAFNEARRSLNALLNREIEYDYTVESDVFFNVEHVLKDLWQKAEQNNSSYLITVNNLKQAKYDLRIVQSSYFPYLSLSSSYGYSQTVGGFDVRLNDPNRSFTAGATLSFNLFNGWQKSINKQNARLQIENQKLLLQEARMNLEKELNNIYASYKNSRYILNVQQNNLQSAELNFDRTKELYDLGQVTSTQFREAQLNLIRAKTNIANAKFDAKLFEFQLMKLTGELVRMDN